MAFRSLVQFLSHRSFEWFCKEICNMWKSIGSEHCLQNFPVTIGDVHPWSSEALKIQKIRRSSTKVPHSLSNSLISVLSQNILDFCRVRHHQKFIRIFDMTIPKHFGHLILREDRLSVSVEAVPQRPSNILHQCVVTELCRYQNSLRDDGARVEHHIGVVFRETERDSEVLGSEEKIFVHILLLNGNSKWQLGIFWKLDFPDVLNIF